MARGTSHGEDGRPGDIEDLAAHQVQHMRACDVDAPAVPLGFGEFRQHPVVLVIAVDEACRPRLGLEPVEPVAVGVRAVPHESEVAGDHHHVVARERPAVRPALGGEAAGAVFGPSVHVARYEDRHQFALSRLYAASSRSTCLSPVWLTHHGHLTRPHGSPTPENHARSSSRLTGAQALASTPTS